MRDLHLVERPDVRPRLDVPRVLGELRHAELRELPVLELEQRELRAGVRVLKENIFLNILGLK